MSDRPVRFTRHALDKLKEAQEFGFAIDQDTVLEILLRPEDVLPGRFGRSIAQGSINDSHLLRIVIEENDETVVVTLYPASKDRYEV